MLRALCVLCQERNATDDTQDKRCKEGSHDSDVIVAQAEDARALPPALAAMHEELAKDFPPVIEDRALEGELRLCLQRIAAQHWRLHA